MKKIIFIVLIFNSIFGYCQSKFQFGNNLRIGLATYFGSKKNLILGFFKENETIILVRFLKRADIYKLFPKGY
jgi:hypothetical protein